MDSVLTEMLIKNSGLKHISVSGGLSVFMRSPLNATISRQWHRCSRLNKLKIAICFFSIKINSKFINRANTECTKTRDE